MAGGKPKNDGQALSIRISHLAHANLAKVLAYWAAEGQIPSLRTKGLAVEAALQFLVQAMDDDALLAQRGYPAVGGTSGPR